MRHLIPFLRYGPIVLFLLISHAQTAVAVDGITAEPDSLQMPTSDRPLDLSHEKLKPGARIKVWPAAGSLTGLEKNEQLQGYLRSCEEGILTMVVGSQEGQPVSLPLAEVTAVQVWTSGASSALGGALVGALVGGIVAIATQPDRSNEGWLSGLPREQDMIRGLGLIVGGIAVGGAVAGGHDKWENISVRYEASGDSGHRGQPGVPGSSLKLGYGLQF